MGKPATILIRRAALHNKSQTRQECQNDERQLGWKCETVKPVEGRGGEGARCAKATTVWAYGPFIPIRHQTAYTWRCDLVLYVGVVLRP